MDKLNQLAIVIKMSNPNTTTITVLEYEAKIRGIKKEITDYYVRCLEQEKDTKEYNTAPILTASARTIAQGFMKYRTQETQQKYTPQYVQQNAERYEQQRKQQPSFLEKIIGFFKKPLYA